jgi:hypothetical protein
LLSLKRYGADAEPARNELLQYAEHKAADLFPDNPADVRLSNQSTYELLQRLEDMLLNLKPANPRDQWWLAQAMTLAAKIGDIDPLPDNFPMIRAHSDKAVRHAWPPCS